MQLRGLIGGNRLLVYRMMKLSLWCSITRTFLSLHTVKGKLSVFIVVIHCLQTQFYLFKKNLSAVTLSALH